MAEKWLDSIEKQNRRSIVCDRQMDRQTMSTTKNNRLQLGSEIKNNTNHAEWMVVSSGTGGVRQ